jgi:hypothetical protein
MFRAPLAHLQEAMHNHWYIACVLCLLAAPKVGVELVSVRVECANTKSASRWFYDADIQCVSKRMTRFQIIIRNNENVLQLQKKLHTINP